MIIVNPKSTPRMSLVQNSSPHHHDNSNVGYGGGTDPKSNGDDTECMKQHLQHAIMQYHADQLTLPATQASSRQTDVTKPLASHSPTYFSSPYKQSNALHFSHPEPILSTSNVPHSQQYPQISHSACSNHLDAMPVASNNTTANKSRVKPTTTEKLPPIFSQISPRRSKKQLTGRDNNLWLGPPNSIPPNKRSEHIEAYKTIAKHRKSVSRHSTHSKMSWTKLQRQQQSKQESAEDDEDDEAATSSGRNSHRQDDDNDSVCSVYSDDDTFSEGNLSTFRSLRGIDTPMHHHSSGRESNSSSVHMERASKREYTESNFGNYSTKVALPSREHSYLDQLSVLSSTSVRNKKSVRFAPDVREISRETKTQPLSGSKLHANPMGMRMVSYNGSTESLDQLPAIVEKFSIRSLPILPNIIPNAMNVSANVIYIKGDGQMHSANSSALSYSRRTASSRSFSSRSFSGSSYKQQSGYSKYRDFDDEDEEEEYNNDEKSKGSAASKTKSNKKQVKIVIPSTKDTHTTNNTDASLSNPNSSPTSSQPNSNRVTHRKTATNLPKKPYSTAKKVTFQKTAKTGTGNSNGGSGANNSNKKTKKPKNGSETSSRTSTNSSSPILDPDDPEQRYSQAMLAVQARMRELDTKFGAPQKIEVRDDDEYMFGKVVVPSACTKDMKTAKR